jgi:hypothetical protein
MPIINTKFKTLPIPSNRKIKKKTVASEKIRPWILFLAIKEILKNNAEKSRNKNSGIIPNAWGSINSTITTTVNQSKTLTTNVNE